MYAAMLEDTATGRYHPIVFRPAPRPSDDLASGVVCRHRSAGHHTGGFETIDEGWESVKANPEWIKLDVVFGWDSSIEAVPTTTLDLVAL